MNKHKLKYLCCFLGLSLVVTSALASGPSQKKPRIVNYTGTSMQALGPGIKLKYTTYPDGNARIVTKMLQGCYKKSVNANEEDCTYDNFEIPKGGNLQVSLTGYDSKTKTLKEITYSIDNSSVMELNCQGQSCVRGGNKIFLFFGKGSADSSKYWMNTLK